MGLSRWWPAVPVLLVLTAGCSEVAGGGTASSSTASPTASPTPMSWDERSRIREEQTAACMKKKGFRYIPFVPKQPQTEEEKKMESGDYEATKSYRQKYGLNAFAQLAKPDDPKANPASLWDDNPNDKITKNLSPSQMESYFKAQEKCFIERVKAQTGKTVKGYQDHDAHYQKAWEAEVARVLDGDPALADLAVAYADCLKGQGIPVTSAKPSKVGSAVSDLIREELYALGRKQNPKAKEGMNYVPQMTAKEARPYFEKEVRWALADLDCGREFDKLAKPKYDEIGATMEREWGFGL